ncbi:MAG: peptidylprolyl isomerase [Anaerolineales bacterium]|nr:peptidylprolyl isomerase [Anaerolineales bacterium]MBS3752002.1 peptidylprolyl isomerase [Anaerolineales bacterium]
MRKLTYLGLTLIVVFIVSSCGTGNQPVTPEGTPTPVPPTRTPFPPSPTPIPIAAEVNGELISMSEYQSELARYKAAVGRDLTSEDRLQVVHDLIHLMLLEQGAQSRGYEVSREELQTRISNLDPQDQPLAEWLAEYGYTEESFEKSLKRAIAAAWMRDTIIEQVPDEMEQIHAQQILLYEKSQGEGVLEEIESGTDFAQLAKQYDPQTRGDLGWFPRGYLTIPVLDEILFNLEPGEISDMIETEIGFHIIKVIEKDEDRPLAPDVRRVLQEKALDDWLERQWNLSKITISIPQK